MTPRPENVPQPISALLIRSCIAANSEARCAICRRRLAAEAEFLSLDRNGL